MSNVIKHYAVQNQVANLSSLQNKVSFMMKARADWYRSRSEKLSKIISFIADLIGFDDDDYEFFNINGVNDDTINERFQLLSTDCVSFVNGIGAQCANTVGSIVSSFCSKFESVSEEKFEPEQIAIPVSRLVQGVSRSTDSEPVYLKDLTEYYSNNYYSMKGRSAMYSFLSAKGITQNFKTQEIKDAVTRELNIDWIPNEVQDVIGCLPDTVNVSTVLQSDVTIIENAYQNYDADVFQASEFDYSMTDAIGDALGDILDSLGSIIKTFGKVIVAMIKGAKDVAQLIGSAVRGLVNLIFPDLGTWFSSNEEANAYGLGIPYGRVKANLLTLVDNYISKLTPGTACYANIPILNGANADVTEGSLFRNNSLTPCMIVSAKSTETSNTPDLTYLNMLKAAMEDFINDTIGRTGLLTTCIGNIVLVASGTPQDATIELFLTNQYVTNSQDDFGVSDLVLFQSDTSQDVKDGFSLATCYFNDYKFTSMASLPVHLKMKGEYAVADGYDELGKVRFFRSEAGQCIPALVSLQNDNVSGYSIHNYSNNFIDWSKYYNEYILYNQEHPSTPKEFTPADFVKCLKVYQNEDIDPTFNQVYSDQDYNEKVKFFSWDSDSNAVSIIINLFSLMVAFHGSSPASKVDAEKPLSPIEDTLIVNGIVDYAFARAGETGHCYIIPVNNFNDNNFCIPISGSSDNEDVFWGYLTDAAPIWEFMPMSMAEKSAQVKPYLMSIVCAAALAAATVVAVKLKKFSNNRKFKKHQKMLDKEFEYWMNPNASTYRKYTKATKRYGKVSGLLNVINPQPLSSVVSNTCNSIVAINDIIGDDSNNKSLDNTINVLESVRSVKTDIESEHNAIEDYIRIGYLKIIKG